MNHRTMNHLHIVCIMDMFWKCNIYATYTGFVCSVSINHLTLFYPLCFVYPLLSVRPFYEFTTTPFYYSQLFVTRVGQVARANQKTQ